MKKLHLCLSIAILAAALGACVPAPQQATHYPTFTPLSGFVVLGFESPTPEPAGSIAAPSSTPAETQTPTETPTASPSATTTEPAEARRVTLLFTGQIVPARCVQAETDRLGQADYIYENVVDITVSADLTIGALNASLTDFPPTTGCVETFVLIGRSLQADAMAQAGFDIMSVATNHIKNCGLTNCGDQAFLDTLDNLQRVGIMPVGAGINHQEAMLPVVVEKAGVRFAFVSLGQIEPLAFAGDTTPGIAVLNEENLREAIAAAREVADVVIVLPHWGPEYTHYPNASQMSLAAAAVEAGADLVVGNHTHYIQAFVEIDSVPVFFGLGNFVFDQIQEPQRQQSLILRITFEGDQIVSTEIIPVVNEQTGKVRVADQAEVVEILTRIHAINADVQSDFP